MIVDIRRNFKWLASQMNLSANEIILKHLDCKEIGNMIDANVGSVLVCDGNWKVDAKYGRQFVAENWEETLPATVYGMEKYLGSGLIKGVGPKFAKKIVQKYGVDTKALAYAVKNVTVTKRNTLLKERLAG